jgi:mannose-6-phosphate isomerase-like protein (cupin superfamily)
MVSHQNASEAVSTRKAVLLEPGDGRAYPMGRIGAVFKADGVETQDRYSISEWWLEPHTQGPGTHAHSEDDIFYVIEGTMSLLVGEHWTHATKGSFVLVPGGVVHDFENRTGERAAVLNVSVPGEFEKKMPSISAWFAEHPPKDAGI